MEWQVQDILRFCCDQHDELEDSGVPDESKPHMLCFLTNQNALLDGETTTAELSAVAWLAVDQALKPGYKGHRKFPVGLITIKKLPFISPPLRLGHLLKD